MSVRAKFRVASVSAPREINQWLADEGRSGKREVFDINLYPVSYEGSEENKRFYASTPGGMISLSTINQSAAEQFVVGKEYYVDFTEAQ